MTIVTLNTLEYMKELRTNPKDPVPALLHHGDLDAIIKALEENQHD